MKTMDMTGFELVTPPCQGRIAIIKTNIFFYSL